MHQILQAILKLDILAPPKEYMSDILSAICEPLECVFGVAIDASGQDKAAVFAAYNLPESFHALVRDEGAKSLTDLWAPVVDNPAVVVHYPVMTAVPGPWGEFFAKHRIATVIRVPLVSRGAILGYCDLYDTRILELIPEEMQILLQIGEMASVAIASNSYLEQLNIRTRELQEEIQERKRMENALREALRERKQLEEIVNRSPVVVFLWRTTKGWPIEFASRSIEQFGYDVEEFYADQMTFFKLIHPDDIDRVSREIAQYDDDGMTEYLLVFRLLTKSGEVRWVETHVWARRDNDGSDLLHLVSPGKGVTTHLQGVMQDITERKQAEETIRHQAFHDTLTDLPNRILFHDRLTLALAHARRHKSIVAVMFLDLDRFKQINDTLGHAVGDQVLKGVAERLRYRLREEDTVSRLGGDEFTILLPGVKSSENAANVARKILDSMRPSFYIDGHEIVVSTSIGISMYPSDGEDPQSLLQNADTALYYAKEHGRNNFQFYTPSLNAKTLERLAMENSLRFALERKEFVVHYQPQVEIHTGQLIGMEALVRWQHPELGLVLPARFLTLSEETGLIEAIGDWVLRMACKQNAEWQRAGHPPVRVSVNLSARQFHQENLTENVLHALAVSGLEPKYLELEVTESVAMRNVDFSISVMRKLKDIGVHLSMDDFGVGYSSLIYLKKFPINTLKIDQSFIRGLSTDPNDRAITTAIIAMARSLKLRVIAEGVENEDQLSFLKEHGCNAMQGYLFSASLPDESFEQLLRFLAI